MKRWTRADKEYMTYEECKELGTNEYHAREQELCRRLKRYEDLEEQGRIAVLPSTLNKLGEKTAKNNLVKDDDGKLEILKCPTQIIKDIAEVRMYGYKKYGEQAGHWDSLEINRYINALLRHTLEFMKDRGKVDSESGLEHYKHMACNMAFICEMMGREINS